MTVRSFIYTVLLSPGLLSQNACTPSSTTTNVDTMDATGMMDAADTAPAVRQKDVGERCQEGECRRGACVHGVCSPICSDDDDCGTPAARCLPRGSTNRCSISCQRHDDCADGLFCAVSGPDLGMCLEPGVQQAGAQCSDDAECASWFCSRGRCLGTCDNTSCPEGERCLPLHTQSVCTPTGDILHGGTCRRDNDCISGLCRGAQCVDACPDGECGDDRVCIRYARLNLCERRCRESSDCGPDAFCSLSGQERICRTRGTLDADSACVRDTDCHSGRCAEGRCAFPCEETTCPDGYACIRDLTGALCRAAGRL